MALEAFRAEREVVSGALQALPIPRARLQRRHESVGIQWFLLRAVLAHFAEGEVVVVALRAHPVAFTHVRFRLRNVALKALLTAREVVNPAGLAKPISGTCVRVKIASTVVQIIAPAIIITVTLEGGSRELLRGATGEALPSGGKIVLAALAHPVTGFRLVPATSTFPAAVPATITQLRRVAVEALIAESEIVGVTGITRPVPRAGVVASGVSASTRT